MELLSERIVREPKSVLNWILNTISPLIKNDVLFLKMKWGLKMGGRLNLKNPQTFSEKLQWLKLNNRRPEYTQMVDKAEAKKYVANIIGDEYIIPTLSVYNNAEDIDFGKLPDRFVLKTTHDSGGVFICKDKTTFNRVKVIKDLKKRLKKDVFWENREWPYKNVTPRIIAEQYMEDETGELNDYKLFCFDGEVKALFIATDRSKKEETKFDFYDEDFNHLPFTNGHPNAHIPPSKPLHFEDMKRLASILSKGIPQVRVDFYEVGGKIYFGEMTFFHWSGLMKFKPKEWDYKFGEWIKLPYEIVLNYE